MIREILTIIRVKVWFATVNQYRGLKARYALWKYTKTLSPKQQQYAADLRRRLKSAGPQGSAGILIREARSLSETQMRLVEKIDRVIRS